MILEQQQQQQASPEEKAMLDKILAESDASPQETSAAPPAPEAEADKKADTPPPAAEETKPAPTENASTTPPPAVPETATEAANKPDDGPTLWKLKVKGRDVYLPEDQVVALAQKGYHHNELVEEWRPIKVIADFLKDIPDEKRVELLAEFREKLAAVRSATPPGPEKTQAVSPLAPEDRAILDQVRARMEQEQAQAAQVQLQDLARRRMEELKITAENLNVVLAKQDYDAVIAECEKLFKQSRTMQPGPEAQFLFELANNPAQVWLRMNAPAVRKRMAEMKQAAAQETVEKIRNGQVVTSAPSRPAVAAKTLKPLEDMTPDEYASLTEAEERIVMADWARRHGK